jgi:glutathione S-transferase
VDGDFTMNESRAIVAYLVNAHGAHKQDLYPLDPKVRARVDQRMYFEMGTFYLAFADCCVSRLSN